MLETNEANTQLTGTVKIGRRKFLDSDKNSARPAGAKADAGTKKFVRVGRKAWLESRG
jgi:hypothetical protein